MQQEIKHLIGIPFVENGRNIETGLDCWGLLLEATKAIGLNIPDYKVSAFDVPKIASTMANVQNLWQKYNKADKGLVVSFAINPNFPNVTQHFGLCLSCNTFLHTRVKSGSVIERLDNIFWKNKTTGFWRWQG